MPAKNKLKIYGEGVFYHAYNRGHNQQIIFKDDHDYKTFLYLLRKYLEPGFKLEKYTPKGEKILVEANHVYNEVDLLAFCLMPNHFHLLLYQKSLRGMPKLLIRLCSNYSTYLNHKYETTGTPFQGTYKAVPLKNENQLKHVSRYIHANPLEFAGAKGLASYQYSSYPLYLKGNNPSWLKTSRVINLFKSPITYRNYVEDFIKMNDGERSETIGNINSLTLE